MSIGRTIQSVEAGTYEGGCNYSRDLTSLKINESPNSMNIIFGDTIRKRTGYKEINSTATGASDKGHSIINFGVSAFGSGQKMIAHMGSTVYKMDNLDGEMDVLLSPVSNSTSFNRVVKQRLIQTYDDNSAEYYWDGSTDAMLPLSPDSPGFKHCIEFQGYLLGGNVTDHSLRIYYEDINTMIGGTYSDYFTLTGGQNDELEEFFLINGRCYAGTSTGIFHLSYIGGVAVFEYKNVVSDVGIVPRTLQVVLTSKEGEGQVAIFLGTDKNIYMFNGSKITDISGKYRFPNNDTEFALEDIDDNYIKNSNAVYDIVNKIYRLFVTKKGEQTNTIAINIDAESFAYYPFDNMTFASAAVVKDNLKRLFLVGADYAGKTHKMFRNHSSDNGKVILEYYESPLLVTKNAHIKKTRSIDLSFMPVADYKLQYSDRVDFDKTWKARVPLNMFKNRDKFLGETTTLGTTFKLGSENEIVVHKPNIPVTENAYRFRLKTDGSTKGDDCYYILGTATGTGGGTTITGIGTTWTSDMTVANGYRIHIIDGLHANTTYTFEYVSATSATVSTMLAGDFTGVSYEIYKTNCSSCSKGWELLKMDYNTQLLAVGDSEVLR